MFDAISVVQLYLVLSKNALGLVPLDELSLVPVNTSSTTVSTVSGVLVLAEGIRFFVGGVLISAVVK